MIFLLILSQILFIFVYYVSKNANRDLLNEEQYRVFIYHRLMNLASLFQAKVIEVYLSKEEQLHVYDEKTLVEKE